MSDIAAIKDKYESEIAGAADLAALDDIRVAALGKKGEVSMMMRGLGQMSPEEKKVMGPALNGLNRERDHGYVFACRCVYGLPASSAAGHGRNGRDFFRYGVLCGRRS